MGTAHTTVTAAFRMGTENIHGKQQMATAECMVLFAKS